MKILVADDDPIFVHLVEHLLRGKYEVVTAGDGEKAWEYISRDDGPRLALLDWQMPGLDGLEVCRRARRLPAMIPVYLLLLTSRKNATDIRAGFEAGADDYLTKPFDPEELSARVAVGQRILQLQDSLSRQVTELEGAMANIRRLQGLLPICSWCKRIRNDHDYWEILEKYLSEHSEATFTHGVCPECSQKVRAEIKAPHPAPSVSET
jgi:sigma-B regulation protein RsbU (phosphoserine phosphatase)